MSSNEFTWLPALLAEIAEVIGLEAALKIAETRGGGRLSIPANVTPESTIAKLVGFDKARLLSEHFGAGFTSHEFEIPLGPTGARASQTAAQAKAIERLMVEGYSNEEIARRLRIASRTVRRHKARHSSPSAEQAPDDRQGRLF